VGLFAGVSTLARKWLATKIDQMAILEKNNPK
jgi:hypothetical protein